MRYRTPIVEGANHGAKITAATSGPLSSPGQKSRFVAVGSLLVLLLAFLLTGSSPAWGASQIPVPGQVTMVDLGAKECIPCQMMAPILVELEQEYRGRAAIIFIDVWENPAAARHFGVRTIPTQIFYDREGREVYRHVGFMGKSAISQRIDRMLGGATPAPGVVKPTGRTASLLERLVVEVNRWLTGTFALALLGSFIWGMISVLFSPCHLAAIPLIIAYVGGQNQLVAGRQAAQYAALFSFGLFLTIAMVGVVTVLLGRMLGDVGPYWTILVGLILLWLAVDMLGFNRCSLPGGGLLAKLRIKGAPGALVLGLAYGILSGTCTFGFIAPLLAVASIQGEIAAGIMLITFYAVGHCLPIAIAGGSTARIKRLIEARSLQQGSIWLRRLAGVTILALGLYFILRPFIQ